ncbi:MAG: PEP-CTERM sorting domain-containing protein [Planctomycetaceae bacterium]
MSTGTQSTWYKWIAAQTFTIPETNNYYLNFPSAVDNRLDYFVNGTIDYADPRQPTISGGFKITTTNTASGQFLSITNNTNAIPILLAAGTHTAYMVLTDLGNATGVLIGPSEFSTAPLPEPSTLALASIAACAQAVWSCRRRARRASGTATIRQP